VEKSGIKAIEEFIENTKESFESIRNDLDKLKQKIREL